jgi:hypothetical protein
MQSRLSLEWLVTSQGRRNTGRFLVRSRRRYQQMAALDEWNQRQPVAVVSTAVFSGIYLVCNEFPSHTDTYVICQKYPVELCSILFLSL